MFERWWVHELHEKTQLTRDVIIHVNFCCEVSRADGAWRIFYLRAKRLALTLGDSDPSEHLTLPVVMTSVADRRQHDRRCLASLESHQFRDEFLCHCDRDQGIRAAVRMDITRQLDRDRVEDRALCEMIEKDGTRDGDDSKGEWLNIVLDESCQ